MGKSSKCTKVNLMTMQSWQGLFLPSKILVCVMADDCQLDTPRLDIIVDTDTLHLTLASQVIKISIQSMDKFFDMKV